MVKAGVMALAAALAIGGIAQDAAAAERPRHGIAAVDGPAFALRHGPRFQAFVPQRDGRHARTVAGNPLLFAPAPGPFVPRPYFATRHDTHRRNFGFGVYGYDIVAVGAVPLVGLNTGVTTGYFSSYDRCAWLADRVRHGGIDDWQRRYNACRDMDAAVHRY